MTVNTLNEVELPEDTWLANLLATLRQRILLIVAVTAVTLIVSVFYLRTAHYLYTSELRVYAAPSSPGQPQLPGGLSGLASIAGIGTPGAEAATPFRLYIEGIASREVAERLARDRSIMQAVFAREWNPATRTWSEKRGITSSIKHLVWGILGIPLPSWHAPDAARLQTFIGENVVVTQSTKTPIVSISMQSEDPVFAARFLSELGATVDTYLREKQQARTRSNIDYLSDKLRGVTLIEQRQALFNALSDQERQAMLANSSAPYAANPFGTAVSSTDPTSPRQIPVLLAGLIGGLILGIAAALLLGPRRRSVAVIESA